MPTTLDPAVFVLGVSPLERPDPRVVAAVCRAGGVGILDLGTDASAARGALKQLARWVPSGIGVRTGAGCPLTPAEVLELTGGQLHTVLVADGAQHTGWPSEVAVLVEVTGPVQAHAALATGRVDGLVARGHEAGGTVGDLSTFVLLQQLLTDDGIDVPVWAAGGIGVRTATAAIVGGAAGVVLDIALALLPESELPGDISAALRRMDGSESVLLDGRRSAPGPRGMSLPVGQDSFLAARFAASFRDTGDAVRAVRDAVIRAASAVSPGAPVQLGCPLPVVQGPMTRVSDQADFAAAVADEGGLPFLALALSSAEQTRSMLEQTRSALGDRPWGVGVLGFAAEELREAQLAVVLELKPTHAIIAGGRPAQAARLEAEGIATFLHVPSPGLLAQYLAAGSRRFVFEGSECGGHVGPRASFALWEAQLGVLADHVAHHGRDDVQVLFAGGVHDARSAAMVRALALDLVDGGVTTGVLMGTAYLFTAEAVSAGAIVPTFQQELVEAVGTTVLETAPGHATRILETRFAADFAAEKARLTADGVDPRDLWEQLEQLNLGRMRIASKGLRRAGDRLGQVDEHAQRAEGMYMAGQVAALRERATTMAQLHEDVGAGADRWWQNRTAALQAVFAPPPPVTAAPLDIAIVGMECMFPNSPDLTAFWATVLDGVDAVTEVPAERWDAEHYYDEAATGRTAGHRTPSRWGGFLPPIAFDPLRYGIPPTALASIEPSQLLALEVARRALVDAGYDRPGVDHGSTAVIFGAEGGSDLSNAGVLRNVLPAYLGDLPPELDEQLPRLTEDSFPGVLSNVISGRIANRLDLGGANYTVDAACASSLAAVDLACRQLRDGSSDLVLCGAVDLHNGIHDFLLFSSVHALSPTGHSRTFDSSADGIALGEGVACVVLKRLADAERDGDRVYAVIAGVGAASDGRALGLTAPRPEGQRRALDRAYAAAGIVPSSVGLVEAHGTGTVVGDRTELATITDLFTAHGAAPGACTIGSVKSQIGHTKCAAGMAGLIKAAMAIHTGVRPPTLGLRAPNASWDAATSPFSFTDVALPWAAEQSNRVAGVSAFGFGGTNFHVVLRGHGCEPDQRHGRDQWPSELFTFRGADSTAAVREVEWLQGLLSTNDAAGRPWRLRDLAATAARRAESRRSPVRIALVADDLDDLVELLARAVTGEHAPRIGLHQSAEMAGGAKVAWLFPGQGSQRPAMLAELFVTFPELQEFVRLADAEAPVLFPGTAFDAATTARQADAVRDTRVAQPVLGVAGLAVDHLLRRLEMRPDMVGGHSYGELVALASARVIDAATLLRLSRARGELILAATGEDPGTMAAVAASAPDIEAVLERAGLTGTVALANQNSPRQTVISGSTAGVARAVEVLGVAGVAAKPIPVACAFHSPLVASAAEPFGAVLDDCHLDRPQVPVYANRTAAQYGDVREELTAQIGSPVRFVDQIEAMYAAGARVFVEAGPGQVLTRLVGAVLGDREHVAVAVEPRTDAGVRGLLETVAALSVAGVELSTAWLFRGRDARDVGATTPPRRPGWTVDGHLVRTVDGAPLPGGLAPARRITVQSTPSTAGGSQMSDPSTGQQELLAEYLRTSRELIAAQRDVMLGFLGSGAAGTLTWQAAPAPAATAAIAAPVVGTTAPAASRVPAPSAAHVAPVPQVGVLPLSEVEQVVLDVVADRTGYPVDMIEPDLDLEADLSVDSIKRTEIAGELAVRLGLSAAEVDDAGLEELSRRRTVADIAGWLHAELSRAQTPDPAAAVADLTPIPSPSSAVESVGVLTLSEVEQVVLDVVADRTGYPVDMIEPDLDLEADLSVDSIKRTEIAGELAVRLGLSAAEVDDAGLEELSRRRTVADIAGWLHAELSRAQTPDPDAAVADPTPTPSSATAALGVAPRRMVEREVPLPAATTLADLTGARLLLVGGPVDRHDAVSAQLSAIGGDVVGDLGPDPVEGFVEGPLQGVVWFPAQDDDDDEDATDALLAGLPVLRRALTPGVRWLLAVAPRTLGLRGAFRSLAREFPDVLVRLVEIDPDAAPAAVATVVGTELAATDPASVVIRRGDTRTGLEVVDIPLGILGNSGAGPAGEGAAEALAAGFGPDSVVVLVGGARGIAAGFAATLAAATRCRIELLGRTELTGEAEPAAIAAAHTPQELRSALIASGLRVPAEIERQVSRISARREVAATVARLTELGSEVGYSTVDVNDRAALDRTLKQLHAECGRIDGVVNAAGIIEDKLFLEKDDTSFRRVWQTKVGGARTLFAALGSLPTPPPTVVLFGSIAGVLGNRGQVDYAAANDALAQLGAEFSARSGSRTLTVHWGPWAPSTEHGGMVTKELGASYAQRGIGLVDPVEGALSLLRELAYGDRGLTEVVQTASGW